MKMCDFTNSGQCASVTGSACICGQPGYRIARSYDATYQSEQEARPDWNTIPPKHRTKLRLKEMLARVTRSPSEAEQTALND